jgi:hypothetical protein
MNQRPTISEQIDACRPDSDDLHLPEHAADLAELHGSLRENGEVRSDCERIQRNDRLIRSAMQDVSLPAGLEAKLLAAVQAAQVVPLAGVEQAVREDARAGDTLAVPVPAKASRRWIMKAAVGLGAAAATIAAIFGFLNQKPTDQQITKDQLATQVEEWLRKADARTMTPPTKAALTTFPTRTVVGKVDRFRSISGGITAYSVARGASRATLLVVPTTKAYPVGSLPFTKLGVSGGWQVGAWQKDGILYVIAVPENSDARLDQFAPQQPIG